MKTLARIIETIIAIPITLCVGVIVGVFLPFYFFAQVFESIWGYANGNTNY